MMNKLLLILFLIPFVMFSQEVRSTFTLPYSIYAKTLMIDGKVYVQIAPRKAFGDKPCKSLEELEKRFDSHLLREKKIIQDTTISKNTQHYAFYMDYVPYMRVNYDIYTDGRLQYLDLEDYVTEYNNIRNFSEQRTD